jgi:hypothetical protein
LQSSESFKLLHLEEVIHRERIIGQVNSHPITLDSHRYTTDSHQSTLDAHRITVF